MPYNILMFSMSYYSDWQSGIYNRNFFILQELLKRPEINQIIAVDYLPQTFKQKLKIIKNRLKAHNLRVLENISNKIDKKLTVCSILNLKTIGLFLKKNISSFNSQNSKLILWSYFPLNVDYFDKIKADLKIFEAVDDWSKHSAYKNVVQPLRDNYKIIAEKADIVFTVSQQLKETVFAEHTNAHWIANGVDFRKLKAPVYAKASPSAKATVDRSAGEQSSKFKDLEVQSPVIGYIGIIESRLDFELIKYLAQKNFDKSFVFVGPVWDNAKTQVKSLKKYKNIYFLGRVSYNDIGAYLAQFSAAIIPHKVNDFTLSMSPMKVYEYLAIGLPIVSTQVAQTFSEDVKKLVYTASQAQEFNKQLNLALAEDSKDKKKQRIKCAQENSWESRVDKMMRIIKKTSMKPG